MNFNELLSEVGNGGELALSSLDFADSSLIFSYEKGEVVGFLAYSLEFNPRNSEEMVKVEAVYTAKVYRGQKRAQKMLAELIEKFEEKEIIADCNKASAPIFDKLLENIGGEKAVDGRISGYIAYNIY